MTDTHTEYLSDTWKFESVQTPGDDAEQSSELAQLYALEFGLDLPQTTQEAKAA